MNIWCAGGEGRRWAEWTLAAQLRRLPVSLFGSARGGSWTEGSLSLRSELQPAAQKCLLTWTIRQARDAMTSESHKVTKSEAVSVCYYYCLLQFCSIVANGNISGRGKNKFSETPTNSGNEHNASCKKENNKWKEEVWLLKTGMYCQQAFTCRHGQPLARICVCADADQDWFLTAKWGTTDGNREEMTMALSWTGFLSLDEG